MKKSNALTVILFAMFCLQVFVSDTAAQSGLNFTGTVLSHDSGVSARSVTNLFTLNVKGFTSDEQAERYLDILKDKNQDRLLDAITDQDLGRFSIGTSVGVPINVVRESMVDGKRRIFIVFQRWTQFAELRYGYRSLDYPFGVIELFIDERTGKGEGTYIAAAKIRWDFDKDKKLHQVEIQNFATFPARLLNVKQSGAIRP